MSADTVNSQQKENPARPCYQALSGDPRFAPIREKVALIGALAREHFAAVQALIAELQAGGK